MSSLTARRYAVHLMDLNEYLASFLGTTLTDKIGLTELNGILLNSIINISSKKAHVQDFDCVSITLKNL